MSYYDVIRELLNRELIKSPSVITSLGVTTHTASLGKWTVSYCPETRESVAKSTDGEWLRW